MKTTTAFRYALLLLTLLFVDCSSVSTPAPATVPRVVQAGLGSIFTYTYEYRDSNDRVVLTGDEVRTITRIGVRGYGKDSSLELEIVRDPGSPTFDFFAYEKDADLSWYHPASGNYFHWIKYPFAVQAPTQYFYDTSYYVHSLPERWRGSLTLTPLGIDYFTLNGKRYFVQKIRQTQIDTVDAGTRTYFTPINTELWFAPELGNIVYIHIPIWRDAESRKLTTEFNQRLTGVQLK